MLLIIGIPFSFNLNCFPFCVPAGIFTLAFPIAIIILPQLGSSPAIAVLTNGEFAIEKQIFFASFSFLHFSTFIVTNFEAPSPSAATLLAKFFKTKFKDLSKSFKFLSLKDFTSLLFAYPVANILTISLVLVSPSQLIALNVF